jgi:hypothetical protein
VRRILRIIWGVLSSRALPPLVIGFFLLLYIGIAFFTDETLIALMGFTRRSVVLAFILALLPLNAASRIMRETGRYLNRRRALSGNAAHISPELFDEAVSLPVASQVEFPPVLQAHQGPGPLDPIGSRSPVPDFTELEGRLVAVGYNTHRSASALTAWRGASIFPARLLSLAGTFCLFAGILISLTTRTSNRGTVIEGEPFPAPSGVGGIVERINFEKSSGSILEKDLFMVVAAAGRGEVGKVFGVYPPSRDRGVFVYPRYLGIALLVRFSAPDLPAGIETQSLLNIYPPGKEAATVIPGSPYRIVFSLVAPDDGSDPYMSGRMLFRFKLLKGKEVVLTGSAPGGAEFARDGYRLFLPNVKRLVITDFVRDQGVLLIWAAGILFIVACVIRLPLRVFCPRREMLFMAGPDGVKAFSRAEGKGRSHAGVFHEALDLLEMKRPERQSI